MPIKKFFKEKKVTYLRKNKVQAILGSYTKDSYNF